MTGEYLLNQGVAVAVLVASGLFIWRNLWPWLTTRDEQQREHRYKMAEIERQQEQRKHDRQHELDERRIAADGALADALRVLAAAVDNCPVKPLTVGEK